MTQNAHFVVGLTGGIGSGKSTVAQYFAECGVVTIDADAVSHQLTQSNGAAMPRIQMTFGQGVIAKDGGLNRDVMRQLIFADADSRMQLETILHPMILQQITAKIDALPVGIQKHQSPYVIVAAPLLLEAAGFRKMVDRVLVVDCDEAAQLARVALRSQLLPADVKKIIATQMAREIRNQLADDVIANNGSASALVPLVKELHLRYLGFARTDSRRQSAAQQ